MIKAKPMAAVVIFDGVCGFCNSFVRFVIRRDPQAHFSFAAAQSALGQELLNTSRDALPDSIVLAEGGRLYVKSEAVLRICRRLSGPWSWLARFGWVPLPLRDYLYDWFAKRRYVFGRVTDCPVPTPDERQRIRLS